MSDERSSKNAGAAGNNVGDAPGTKPATSPGPDPGDPGTEGRPTTHFGYRSVGEDEKAPLVRDIFSSVASRYDLMNDLMSMGIHRLWKAAMLDWLHPTPTMRLLDVGGGTGDIAMRFCERGGGAVVVVDINEEMVSVGRDRALDVGRSRQIEWLCGDAENLPIADSSVDAYTTAFCLRNVTRIEKALGEARRVLKPGGHFLCLEFSRVDVPSLSRIYDQYSFRVLPMLGQIVTGNADAYRYLVESIRQFPSQDVLARMIAAAGLDVVRYRNLSSGIAALHSAWRT